MSDLLTEPDPQKFDPAQSDINDVPEWFLRHFKAAMSSPLFSIPKLFETWMIDRVATSGFDLPISQIVGFQQYAVQINSVTTSETCTSTSYTNLSTTGPELTGLPDGNYLLLFGTTVAVGSTDNVYYSPKINSTEAVDADALILKTSTVNAGGVWAVTKTLNGGGNNDVLMRYKVAAGNTNFANRFLVAWKYANL